MGELLAGNGAVLLYFAVCAGSALVVRLCFTVPNEPFRKLLHFILLFSCPVYLFAFDRWQYSAGSALGFAAAVWPILYLAERIPGYSALLTERRGGELKASLLLVFGMFALVIAVCWGGLNDRMLALASVFAWGPGDAAAALVGKRFGRHPLTGRHIEGRKSAEGTAAMFGVSLAVTLGLLLARGGLILPACLLTAALTAAVSAAAELFTRGGRDTFTCPVAAMLTLIALTRLLS